MSVNLFKDLGYDEKSDEVRDARLVAGFYSDIIDELVSCRVEAGLNQKQVAKLMRTTQSAVSEFESANADARFSTLVRYSRAIDCDLVIEITRPKRRSATDWVHFSSQEEAEVIPFPIPTSLKNPARASSLHRPMRSDVNSYVVSVAV